MAEYIEREKLLRDIEHYHVSDGKFQHWVEIQPAADVAPVRHGKWFLGNVEPGYSTPGGNRPLICSECKQVISWSLGMPFENYCTNCGARMGGGADNG